MTEVLDLSPARLAGLRPLATAVAAELEPERQRLLRSREQDGHTSRGATAGAAVPPATPLTPRMADIEPAGATEDRPVATGGIRLCTPVTPVGAAAALRSGADVWVADLEDGFVPLWPAQLAAHRVLGQFVRDDGRHPVSDHPVSDHPVSDGPVGRNPAVDSRTAVVVRPRGFHLTQPAVGPGGPTPPEGLPGLPGAVVDVLLHLATCTEALLTRGARPRFVLPKIESAEEARWWDRLLGLAEAGLGLLPGTVRVDVLVETVPVLLDLDGVVAALLHRLDALVAGRSDYLGSWLRTFGHRPEAVLPDLGSVTMTTRLLARYTGEVLAAARRHDLVAIGGPVADDVLGADGALRPAAAARVLRDKGREAREGFDGAWLCHPAHVPLARAAFETADTTPASAASAVTSRPAGPAPALSEEHLADTTGLVGEPTLAGLRPAVHQSLAYLAAWLGGEGRTVRAGCVADLGTVEVLCRQLASWHRHRVRLAEGPTVSTTLVHRVVADELAVLARAPGAHTGRLHAARDVLVRVVTTDRPPAHLTDLLLPLLGDVRPGPAESTVADAA